MDRLIERCVEYMKMRTQGGGWIAEYQGLQWMLADMAVARDASRLITERAIETLMRGERGTLEASAAKLFATESLAKVADALTMLLQFSAIMGVVVWGGTLWRRANSPGAWAAVAVLFLVWVAYGPVGGLLQKSLGGPAWLGMYGPADYMFELTIRFVPAGIATLIVVSLLTPPPPAKKVDDFAALLRTPVGRADGTCLAPRSH